MNGKVEYNVEGQFDWLEYKAQVAASVLPIILRQKWAEHDNSQMLNADDVAINTTIDIAVKIADRLEQRMKGGGQ